MFNIIKYLAMGAFVIIFNCAKMDTQMYNYPSWLSWKDDSICRWLPTELIWQDFSAVLQQVDLGLTARIRQLTSVSKTHSRHKIQSFM